MDEFNRSKGFAVVRFATEEAADKAVDKAHGILLGSKKIVVSPFPPRRQCLAEGASRTSASFSIDPARTWGAYKSERDAPVSAENSLSKTSLMLFD